MPPRFARLRFAALTALALGACARSKAPARPTPTRPAARGAVVARVGAEPITASEVAARAATGGLTARAALDSLVRDELLAQEALRRLGPDALDDALWRARIQALLVRAVEAPNDPRDLAGAPLDEALVQLRPDVAPGPRRNVVHALFAAPPGDSPARVTARARALALRDDLLRALGPRPSAADFEAHARRADGVRVERLTPFQADGRAGGGVGYARPFVDGAFALTEEAPVSAPVETDFGVHILLLTEVLPASPRIEDETRALVLNQLVIVRRGQALRVLLESLRARTRVETDPAAVMRLPRAAVR